MVLSNETLVLLSKFSLKAKKHIGLVKLEKLFTNRQYANKVLIKAGLSEDKELIALTKMVCEQLGLNRVEVGAIEAYFNTLSAMPGRQEHIRSSKSYLTILSNYLYGIRANGASYREAVEAMILHVDTDKHALCVKTAREFYPFWMNQANLALNSNNQAALAFDGLEVETASKLSMDMWDAIDSEFFSHLEIQSLNLYVESLNEAGVLLRHINTRRKFAKIILKELRNDNSGKLSYRKAVDKTQYLFSRHDLKEFFLSVSREFYNFWAEVGEEDSRLLSGNH